MERTEEKGLAVSTGSNLYKSKRGEVIMMKKEATNDVKYFIGDRFVNKLENPKENIYILAMVAYANINMINVDTGTRGCDTEIIKVDQMDYIKNRLWIHTEALKELIDLSHWELVKRGK